MIIREEYEGSMFAHIFQKLVFPIVSYYQKKMFCQNVQEENVTYIRSLMQQLAWFSMIDVHQQFSIMHVTIQLKSWEERNLPQKIEESFYS